MDPATLGTVGLVGSGLSGIVGAAGAVSSGLASARSSNYQAAVARNNQIIANQNAVRQEQAGRVQAQNRDFQTRAQVGAIESGQAASGIDTQSGSAPQVRESAQQIGRLDTLTLMSNAKQAVRQSQIEATGFGSQAALDTSQAGYQTAAGAVGGFGSILGGASSFADKWLKYQSTGVPGFAASAT